MALGEAAYAVQSMAEAQEGKAVQSGRWVGKGMQTECKIAKLAWAFCWGAAYFM